MKVAFSVWGHRIAPVFDVASRLHIVHTDSGRIVSEVEETIVDELPAHKALRLAELGITTLVCGAISRELLAAVSAYGIRVNPFIAGELRDVITAQMEGTVHRTEYAMPGCRRRRHAGRAGGYRPSRHNHTDTRKGPKEA